MKRSKQRIFKPLKEYFNQESIRNNACACNDLKNSPIRYFLLTVDAR